MNDASHITLVALSCFSRPLIKFSSYRIKVKQDELREDGWQRGLFIFWSCLRWSWGITVGQRDVLLMSSDSTPQLHHPCKPFRDFNEILSLAHWCIHEKLQDESSHSAIKVSPSLTVGLSSSPSFSRSLVLSTCIISAVESINSWRELDFIGRRSHRHICDARSQDAGNRTRRRSLGTTDLLLTTLCMHVVRNLDRITQPGGFWYRTLWGYFSLPPHQTSIFHLFHISPVTTTPIIYTHTFSSCLSFVPVFRCPRFHLATSISDHPWGLVNQLPWTWGYSCGDAYTGTREVAGIYRQVFGTTLACPNWGRIMPSLSRFILVVRLSPSLPHTHHPPLTYCTLFSVLEITF